MTTVDNPHHDTATLDPLTIAVERLIPQRLPMVLIDSVTQCDQHTTRSRFTVPRDHIMVEAGHLTAEGTVEGAHLTAEGTVDGAVVGGHLTAEGMLENIAQTCAARIGFLNLLADSTVKLGFIGAVRDYRVMGLPAVGQTIDTVIEVKEEIFGITLVDATVTCDDRTLATTTMKIAVSEIEAQQ